jgi:hypothetical protein
MNVDLMRRRAQWAQKLPCLRRGHREVSVITGGTVHDILPVKGSDPHGLPAYSISITGACVEYSCTRCGARWKTFRDIAT